MASSHRYWLALHPDIRKLSAALSKCTALPRRSAHAGQATLIQDDAYFHPGWFQSQVSTISFSAWKQRQDLNPQTDVVVMPETFLPAIPRYGPGLPKLIFNQNGSYSFGFREGDGFPERPEPVLKLYRHPDVVHVLCVSKYDQKLLASGFGLGTKGSAALSMQSKQRYLNQQE